jgi:SAM-dependent methyltransferase
VDLREVRDAWNTFGETDPMWAVLTEPGREGGKWDPEEFFATGRREIAGVMALLDEVGGPQERGAALDFGCGVGRLSQALAEHFESVTGVDIAPSMIAAAERHNTRSNCRFVLNERPDLAVVPDASVDFVYTTIVLQHMPPAAALGYVAEFARVLKPGGMAVLTVPSRPSNTVIGRLYRVVPRPLIHAYVRRRFGAVMQMHGIPMETLVPAMTRAGLRVERVDPDTSPGPNWVGFRYVLRRR